MSTITVILEPQADGTLHLPVPPELRGAKVEVTATLKAAGDASASEKPALPKATPEMLRQRKEAFEALRQMDPYREIEDPVAWQREIRKDRPLPGRE